MVALRRLGLVAGLALSALAAACSDESTSDPEPEAQVRAVVADYYAALFASDGAAACETLSAEGRERVVVAADRTPRFPSVDSCEEMFDRLWTGTGYAPRGQAEIDQLVDEIRSGEADAFAVQIDGDEASVGPGTTQAIEIPLTYVEGQWLIDNGLDPLFDFGIDDLPR
ncbi:hypothetical protein HJD18_03495 [Thermoleophilia bacterium SCSIO 60948]|nr:hypothetical protein HJD18_03495 [Thermoleophilia bacterium SCSIO 60948]